jgi:phage tail protein X
VLAKWLPFLAEGLAVTDPDEVAALREVAEKLGTLRES